MAGRKVEILEWEIGQLKSDCVEKNLYFKKLYFAIHEKINEKFAIMEELMIKMLEFQTKMVSSKVGGPTRDHGSGGNPNPITRGKDQKVEMLEEEEKMPPLEPLPRRGNGEGVRLLVELQNLKGEKDGEKIEAPDMILPPLQ
ncbi:hypothetical protein MA16_Dca028184 [Dendrobium catenatum]|uniref:Uncharacterized protein n=1 Tax=Dendrobium catenatum TaxID=906689 RepID=A0A2I0VHK6_9ASPA|nr:hypothetical protein MA16_Dca028184 [Dendrobium catenatum]